jgi:hypothetical protein
MDSMKTRRDFIKNLSVMMVGSTLPIPSFVNEIISAPTKLTLPLTTSNADYMSFNANGVERMRIMSNGNVGLWLGKSPDSKLEING